MSNEDHIWFDENGEINQGRVHNGNLFATMRDRGLCIRAGLNERQWLKDHPGVWRPLEDVLREAAAWKRRVEGLVKTIATGPSSHTSSPDVRNDGEQNAGSVDVPAGGPSPPQEPVPPAVAAPSASEVEEEVVTIRGRPHVSITGLALMMGGIPRRTLSRWCKGGKGPPKTKLGNQVYFDLDKIPAWLASRRLR
jgi:hypothetical protein